MKNRIKITRLYARLCFFTLFIVGVVFFVFSVLLHDASEKINQKIVERDQVVSIHFLLNELHNDASSYVGTDQFGKNAILSRIDSIDDLIQRASLEDKFDFNSSILKRALVEDRLRFIQDVSFNLELSKNMYFSLMKEKYQYGSYVGITQSVSLHLSWVLCAAFFLLSAFVFLFYLNFKRKIQEDFVFLKSLIKKYMVWDLYGDMFCTHTVEVDEIHELLVLFSESQLLPAKLREQKYEQLDHAFQFSDRPSILVDQHHKIIDINHAFQQLWEESHEKLSALLDVHCDQHSVLVGEYIDEVHFVWLKGTDHKILLENGLYMLDHSKITHHNTDFGYVLSLDFISEKVELGVIHKSIKLMQQGVWDTPIRVKRGLSPLAEISQGLESIRLFVLESNTIEKLENPLNTDKLEEFDELNEIDDFDHLEEFDNVVLEQNAPASFDDSDSFLPTLSLLDKEESRRTGLDHTLVTFSDWEERFRESLIRVSADLVDHLESSVLLGYENIVQKLQIAHKEMQAGTRALNDSTRFLNEVRAITLKALIHEQSKGEVERTSLAKDINHDVDTVISLLGDLADDEQKTIDLFSAEINVAELRKAKAIEHIHNFEPELLSRCLVLSKDLIKPLFVEDKVSLYIEPSNVNNRDDR